MDAYVHRLEHLLIPVLVITAPSTAVRSCAWPYVQPCIATWMCAICNPRVETRSYLYRTSNVVPPDHHERTHQTSRVRLSKACDIFRKMYRCPADLARTAARPGEQKPSTTQDCIPIYRSTPDSLYSDRRDLLSRPHQ